MRIGIFGGTFDPIHRGHIEAARAILHAGAVDRIVFMPTGDPPHKIGRPVTPGALRLRMTEAAVREADEPAFSVSDMEIRRDGYTYTVDTLEALHVQNTGDAYAWIIGADVLRDLQRWRQFETVFRLCTFVALCRPGCSREDFLREYGEMTAAGARIEFVEVPLVDMSSTWIREQVARGTLPEGAVADGVAAIIREEGLYGSEVPEPWSLEAIQADLQKRLSLRRYRHSVGVMEEAVRLAERFGADPVKCALAGILHDAAREFTHAQYLWLGIDIEERLRTAPDAGWTEGLLHAEAAAILAERRYGVRDRDVLEAVACHTTGKPGMGPVAQIVFIADFTEAGRVGAQFDRVRQALRDGLTAAVAAECRESLQYRLGRGDSPVCVAGVETLNWALRAQTRADHKENGGSGNGTAEKRSTDGACGAGDGEPKGEKYRGDRRFR